MKPTTILYVLCIFLFLDSSARDGKKLFSIGSNSAWNSSGTWSLSSNGPSAGTVPQSNDTLIIDRAVVQNVSFTFSEKGILNVLPTGSVRGENLNLYFKGSSTLKCNGEIKSKNIFITDNSLLLVDNKGNITVIEQFSNSAPGNHIVNGSLAAGTIILNESVLVSGMGTLKASVFEGNGSAFSINDLVVIPVNSLITEVNWIGAKNKDWNDAGNWSGGIVPFTSSNVSVLAKTNIPAISSEASCNNLYVNSTATLSIASNSVLTVNGNLTVHDGGTLLLKNTLIQKASLLLNGNVFGKIKSEYPVAAGKNQFVSSPVLNSVSGVFINMYLRGYDENASQWSEYIVPTNTVLQEMKGYELYSLSSQVRLFDGIPNNNSKSFAITNSGNGMNLAGNPFPCYIDWENGESDAWQRNTINSAIYYPDPAGSGNYAVYLPGGNEAVSLNNGNRYIAPMQGFFVKAMDAGIMTVNSGSRISKVHTDQPIVSNTSIKLKLSKNAQSCDEIMMRVNPNSSYAFDQYFDAVKLPGNTGSSWLYMTSNDETQYAVNTIPTVNSSINISVSIVCSEAATYTVSVAGAFNFEYRYPVYLKDKILNTYVDLRQDSTYTFYHSPEMNKDRFELFFNSPLDINTMETDNLSLQVIKGSIEIQGDEHKVYTAHLYSLDGKLICSEQGLLNEGIRLTTSNYPTGIFILKLSNGEKTITKKVFIKE